MKTILILGGFGFIGTNLINYLEKNKPEYELIVFDKRSEHPQGLKFSRLKKVYAGDFSDSEALKKVFQANQIDLVIHAISSTVPAQSDNIEFDIRTNLIPTVSLLNIMKDFSVKDIVYISSGGAIYGASDARHLEGDEASPISSYGIVKLAIEKYLFLFNRQHGLRFLILRPSNLYGRHHYSQEQGMINLVIRCALTNKKFSVWGDGQGKKDYFDVEDFCRILFQLVDKQVFNTVINIGSGNLLSVNEVLSAVKNIIPSLEWQYQGASALDVPQVALDTTRLRSHIGQYKFKSFPASLEEILAWQKSLSK